MSATSPSSESTHDDGGAAFPRLERLEAQLNMYNQTEYNVWSSGGMSLRDYFAAKAMERFLVDDVILVSEVAMNAYAMADAMLAERAK